MSWSEALAEAHASAPAREYPVHTLEMLSAGFVGEGGMPDSIRVALDERPWDLTLEPGAPLNGGQTVTFDPLAMRVVQPAQAEGQMGAMRIALDNVPLDYVEMLEAAAAVRAPARLIYRVWVATQAVVGGDYASVGPPDLIVDQLTAKVVKLDSYTIECEAGFLDLLNRAFPTRIFSREHFPALFGGDVD